MFSFFKYCYFVFIVVSIVLAIVFVIVVCLLFIPPGQGHPMKPHRLALTHSLVLNYGLYKSMEVGVGCGDR